MNRLLVVFIFCGLSGLVSGHGRIVNPPGRSNAWRHGFKTLPNYNDMGLNCGGFANQFNTHGGKCGVCGDPYEQSQPRENEFGGKYGTGLIVKSYQRGEEITVDVDITANHMGHFEFRLCPDPQGVTTHDCLDRYLLETDQGTQWKLPDRRNRIYQIRLKLPPNVVCQRCVLQWLYKAGNSWGAGGLGNGDQEHFINCADISIGSGNMVGVSRSTQPPTRFSPSSARTNRPITPHPTMPPHRPITPHPTMPPHRPITPHPAMTPHRPVTARPPITIHPPIAHTPDPVFINRCRAHPFYTNLYQSMDQWCASSCRPNYCPVYCLCS